MSTCGESMGFSPPKAQASRRLLALLLAGVLHVLQVGVPNFAHALEPQVPALLLAQHYSEKFSVAEYLVSEKLDGVRAYWDGKHLRFRSGRVIQAPTWVIAPLPAHPLDGELWMGRRSFERLSAAVRRDVPVDDEWKAIVYHLYELPDGEGSFSARIDTLKSITARIAVPWLQVLPQERVSDAAALKKRLAAVTRAGGEGLMLHRADAAWQTGRSDVLLKMKPQHDTEAVVVAHVPGKGKYEGMLGALIVETPEGRRFRLGTGFTDAQRHAPPPVGSLVTYRYRDVTANGVPRFASFLRARERERE